MSRNQNHGYLLRSSLRALSTSSRLRVWQILLWLFLVAVFVVGFRTGALDVAVRNADSPLFLLALLVLIFASVFGIRRWREAMLRSTYLRALQDPEPAKLVAFLDHTMRNTETVPDQDALLAQSKAFALALYGRGEEANHVLAQLDWGTRAPLVQALGLSAEGLTELLCMRDVERALEVTRRARVLASMSPSIPGATQSETYHGTCVAVCEALLHVDTDASLKWLEMSVKEQRFPPLNLLASFGLAIVMERSGNASRARDLRNLLRTMAPHCHPLHQPKDAYSAANIVHPIAHATPVSLNLIHARTSENNEARVTIRKSSRVIPTLILWVILMAVILRVWTFLSQQE